MDTLPTIVRPADPAHNSRMNVPINRAVDAARLHPKRGNPAACNRALAGEHRGRDDRRQRAIEAVIVSDGMLPPFIRHADNGCLLAREG